MIRNYKKADLIIGNNVLAHNPNLNNFIKGLKIALKPKGIITLEFPHLLKLITNCQFDTIYHEHFSYFSLYSIKNILLKNNLEIYSVKEIPTHGGSLRIYLKHKEDQTRKVSLNIAQILDKEKKAGLKNLKTYNDFKLKVNSLKRDLLLFLIKAKNHHKNIVGYGAAAKGNTLLNYCGISTDIVDYVVDTNPHKQNKYLPGSHIPVKNPHFIKKDKPDYVLILPWNIKAELIKKLLYIKNWGGKFIIPSPRVKVI